MNALTLVSVSVLALALIAWAVSRGIRSHRARASFLAETGFVACDDERAELEQKVTELERNRRYDFAVRKPWRAEAGGETVYLYTKERRRVSSEAHACEEFLLPYVRASTDPLVMYVKPSSMGEGLATLLARSIGTAKWDAQPEDLVSLPAPADLEGSNLLIALGPKGRSIHDLVGARELEMLLRAGDSGVLVLRFAGGLCSLSAPQAGSWEHAKVWALIRTLVGRR